jgi:antitoxin (DNA-binding transcriptional repressor) of toxin-antitoxin stability system
MTRVKHVRLVDMKTVTVRDLRQKWPAAERALQVEGEIVVTRDGTPVAKLVRLVASGRPRKRFDPATHGKWQRKINGGRITRWVEEGLLHERDER